jgi:hypothetical protein
MNHSFLPLALVGVLATTGCGEHGTSQSNQTANNSTASVAKIAQPPPPEDTSWKLDASVDKMTDAKKNVLTKIATVDQHRYEIAFQCDGDGVGIKMSVYNSDGSGANIPWELSRYVGAVFGNPIPRYYYRNIRIRFGNELAAVTLKQQEYSNVGSLEVLDESKVYVSFDYFLRAKPLNIADVIPSEVIELNPESAKLKIDSFLEQCKKRLAPVSNKTQQASPPAGQQSVPADQQESAPTVQQPSPTAN